jgi:hypothetical protein
MITLKTFLEIIVVFIIIKKKKERETSHNKAYLLLSLAMNIKMYSIFITSIEFNLYLSKEGTKTGTKIPI